MRQSASTFQSCKTQSLNAIYRHYKCDGKLLLNHLDVQRQNDGHNCGLFAVAFAAEVINGSSPIGVRFAVRQMPNHLMKCLLDRELSVFPKQRV